MNSKVTYILNYLEELFPDAKCELDYQNDYQLLIAIILSAQTTDIQVNKVTINLFKKYKSFEELKDSNIKDVENILNSIGLYKNKSKNIINLSKIICDKYHGIIPKNKKELVKLPGVGNKTCEVFFGEYFKIPSLAVDTHVARISKRLMMVKENDSPDTIMNKLKKKIDKNLWILAHHRMIFFGRYFCMSKKPKCGECKLKKYCKVGKMYE